MSLTYIHQAVTNGTQSWAEGSLFILYIALSTVSEALILFVYINIVCLNKVIFIKITLLYSWFWFSYIITINNTRQGVNIGGKENL